MKKRIALIFILSYIHYAQAQTCLMDTSTWRVTPTVDNATVIIPTAAMPTLANQPLPTGTLIGVFNNNQQLCGVATWTGLSNLALTVYGFEAGGRGMTAGETFKFRIKLPDNRMLTQVQATYTAVSGIYTIQGNYVADGIAGIAGFVANYPAVLQPNLNSTAIRCYGGSNGSLSVTPTGGTAPYRYSWSGSAIAVDSVLRNLTIGNYHLEITDNRGCKTILDTVLRQPDSLRLMDTIQQVRCYGGNDGRIRLGVQGGIVPYQYGWQVGNGQNLNAGNYPITLTDANGCTKTSSYRVTQPDSLRLSTTVTPSVVGGSTGTASVAVVGGTPNYRYSWSQRTDTSAIIRNLPPNTYIVTVTDANGCTKNTTIAIITNGLRDDLAEKCLIRVFPNPVLSDAPLHVSVQWHTVMAQPIHVYMRDVFGKIVENSSETIVGNSEQLVRSIHLSAGLYFMVFQVGDFQTIKPIICTP